MKKFTLFVVLSIFMLLAAACGADEGSENADKDDKKETITVKHDLGETEVPKNPKKVAVFDFGTLDTLDELGIDVAGVPQDNVPTYLDQYESDDYEHVGGLKEPDFDQLAQMDPDLIIISGRQSDLYDQFQEIAPTIYMQVDTTRYMDSFKENVRTIGEIFGKEEEADEALDEIEVDIDKLKEKAEATDKEALIILANDDKISAYGPESRFGLIHDVFGIPAVDEGIEASTHGMNVSPEYVKEQNPDLLYVVDRGAVVGDGDTPAKQTVENKLIKKTKAYKNDDITYLDPNYWYLSGGGLESVAEMIKEIDESLNEAE